MTGLACTAALWISACRLHHQVRIAVIPQTEGTIIWEAAHVGVEEAASQTGAIIYWIAPTREDDVEAQIRLVDRVENDDFQGLVLAPDQALSLISPVRRALSKGIPTVIIGSPLPIAAGGNLFYILNDDVEAGQLAAQRVANLLKGHGSVAILGLDPDIAETMSRARTFEQYLAQNDPNIRIVQKRIGSYNVPHEQQAAEDTLKAYPDLGVIVALMSTTIDGTQLALDTVQDSRSTKIIGFDDSGLLPFDHKPNLDCVIHEDTREMGKKAIELIHAKLLGQSVPAVIRLHPKLITRGNENSPEVRRMLSQDWTLGRWKWSPIQ